MSSFHVSDRCAQELSFSQILDTLQACSISTQPYSDFKTWVQKLEDDASRDSAAPCAAPLLASLVSTQESAGVVFVQDIETALAEKAEGTSILSDVDQEALVEEATALLPTSDQDAEDHLLHEDEFRQLCAIHGVSAESNVATELRARAEAMAESCAPVNRNAGDNLRCKSVTSGMMRADRQEFANVLGQIHDGVMSSCQKKGYATAIIGALTNLRNDVRKKSTTDGEQTAVSYASSISWEMFRGKLQTPNGMANWTESDKDAMVTFAKKHVGDTGVVMFFSTVLTHLQSVTNVNVNGSSERVQEWNRDLGDQGFRWVAPAAGDDSAVTAATKILRSKAKLAISDAKLVPVSYDYLVLCHPWKQFRGPA